MSPAGYSLSSKEVRLAFLGGMIDADGHVSKGTTQKVSIGSTNRNWPLVRCICLSLLVVLPRCI